MAAYRTSPLVLPLLVAAFSGVVSCSSAPLPVIEVTDAKNQAAEYAVFGNRHFQRGDLARALEFFELSLRENTAVDHLPGIGSAHTSIGKVYLAAGDTDAAERSFQAALSIAEESGDRSLRFRAATQLAEAALRRGDTAQARDWLERAAADRDAATSADLAVLDHATASVYARVGRFAEAEALLQRAIAANEAALAVYDLASNHFLLASVYSRQGRFAQAIAAAERALDLDKTIENSPGIAADLRALGLIHRRAGDPESAYRYLRRAVQVAATVGLVRETQTALAALAEVAEGLGRPDEAAEYRAQLATIEGIQ